MTKAEVVSEIAKKTGIDKADVLACVEGFMEVVSKTDMSIIKFIAFLSECKVKT